MQLWLQTGVGVPTIAVARCSWVSLYKPQFEFELGLILGFLVLAFALTTNDFAAMKGPADIAYVLRSSLRVLTI